MYKIACPKCGKEFQVEYKNDRTYCNCTLPNEPTYVPSFLETKATAREIRELICMAGFRAFCRAHNK